MLLDIVSLVEGKQKVLSIDCDDGGCVGLQVFGIQVAYEHTRIDLARIDDRLLMTVATSKNALAASLLNLRCILPAFSRTSASLATPNGRSDL